MLVNVPSARPSSRFLPVQVLLVLVTIVAVFGGESPQAQEARQVIEGVTNFGRVTDNYFRGGQVTPDGVANLHKIGVRTIIDLRDEESPGEAESCKENGVKYFKFPMSGHETPDDKTVNKILSIIKESKAPIYVHCSAGKHRAGTIAALYRTRIQGWSAERAWLEQKSYGFGLPEGHPRLYDYVYGSLTSSQQVAKQDVPRVATQKEDDDDDDVDDDDDDDKSARKSSKKGDGNDDDDDDDDSSKAKKEKSEPKAAKNLEKGASSVAITETANGSSSLSAANKYLSQADAVKLARDNGGKGEVVQIDFEWDAARSLVGWDITFTSGLEYELDAVSGKLLGTKPKAPAKLATLEPLTLDGSSKPISFQEIIQKAEARSGKKVVEMELKRLKGRQATFEVVMADGTSLLYDAVTGSVIEL